MTQETHEQDLISRFSEQAQKLWKTLKNIQEPKGYFFNKDTELSMTLLEQLLVTKARDGYMSCPCRIGNGKYELDRDIICPCEYREADVREYGACFCGLYVSKEWNDALLLEVLVPERRPPEKIIF